MRVPGNEAEFQALMEELDRLLQGKGISAPFRQIAAIAELSDLVGRRGTIPKHREPTDGVYNGEDLVLRGIRWYEERYGESLKVLTGPGRAAIMLRGDVWPLRFPMVTGRMALRSSPEGRSRPRDGNIPHLPSGIPDVNVLEFVEGLPEGLAQALRPDEHLELIETFKRYLGPLIRLQVLQRDPLVSRARGELDAAVQHLSSHPPQAGLAKWASLQAAEKLLKAYIASVAGSHPTGHTLEPLAQKAEELGLEGVPRDWLALIQCEASVRYGEQVTLDEALIAHHRSLDVAAIVAQALSDRRQPPERSA